MQTLASSRTFTKAVPAKLQLDAWWLDHETRPFPKSLIPVKLVSKGA